MSLGTPALADRFFTTSTTWEAPFIQATQTGSVLGQRAKILLQATTHCCLPEIRWRSPCKARWCVRAVGAVGPGGVVASSTIFVLFLTPGAQPPRLHWAPGLYLWPGHHAVSRFPSGLPCTSTVESWPKIWGNYECRFKSNLSEDPYPQSPAPLALLTPCLSEPVRLVPSSGALVTLATVWKMPRGDVWGHWGTPCASLSKDSHRSKAFNLPLAPPAASSKACLYVSPTFKVIFW